MEKQNNLPTIAEIISGDMSIPGKLNTLNLLLNQDPPKKWIKEHPIAKGVRYLPIDKVEYLLTKIFVEWYVEVKESKLLANSILTIIRLYYRNPVTGEICWTEGVGAAALQVNAGEKASDFDKLKFNAVEISAPKSKTQAIKDAAETLGKIFGKDLNRRDVLSYDDLINDTDRFKDAKFIEK